MFDPKFYQLPAIIGHRGASQDAPENTLAAIRLAHEQGATWVEFDAKLTKDGVVILIHDDSLDRTSSGTGKLAETNYADLASVEAGNWKHPQYAGEPIPTLIQVIAALAGLKMGANIEIKPCNGREEETGKAVAEVVAQYWPQDLPPPILSSFKIPALLAAKETAPQLARGLLIDVVPPTWPSLVEMVGAVALHGNAKHCTPDLATAVKSRGLGLLTYTVNDPHRARELFALGVDAVITDVPGQLITALA